MKALAYLYASRPSERFGILQKLETVDECLSVYARTYNFFKKKLFFKLKIFQNFQKI